MVCSNCGNGFDSGERFCRKCGTDLNNVLLAPVKQSLLKRKRVGEVFATAKDPDELTANGIGSVIMGDGLLMVAVFLGATHTSISSPLWLLLLIPAFFYFGKGFADVLRARQIYRRLKRDELAATPATAELPLPRASVIDAFKECTSGELSGRPSVTDRTTRQLK
jgi:hypothetical protein